MEQKTVLIILGKRGAGKTSIANLFSSRDKYSHIEVSKYLLDMKEKAGLKKMALRSYVEFKLLEQDKDYFIAQLCNDNLKFTTGNSVVTGIRHMAEISFMRKELKGCQLTFVYLQVSFLCRLFRILKRKERNSLWQFFIEEYYSYKWGDRHLKKEATKIENFSGIENCYMKIKETLTAQKVLQ